MMDLLIDRQHPQLSKSKSSLILNSLMHGYDLVDVWRLLNPSKKYFSLFSLVHKSYSRIDYFLLHSSLLSNVSGLGRRIAQSVARATHVPRLCSGPGFDSRPGSLCCVSLPVSYPVSCLTLQLYYQIKPEKAKKYFKKKMSLALPQYCYI